MNPFADNRIVLTSYKKIPALSFLTILAATFLLYGRTLGYDFVWDDMVLIVNTDALRKWSNFFEFWTTPFFKLAKDFNAPYHRPFVPILILLVSSFSGINPIGYHLANLLLYAFGSWLFYRFLDWLRTPRSVQILSVGIFLLHPVHVEVVVWPSCISILFAAVCFFGCWKFSLGLPSHQNITWPLLGLWVLYGIGLLTYDLFVALPFLIVMRDFLRPDLRVSKPKNVRIWEYAGLVLISIAWLGMRLYFVQQMGGVKNFEYNDPNAANILVSGQASEFLWAPLNVVIRYLELLLFPMLLTPEVYFKAGEVSLSAVSAFILFAGISSFIYQAEVRRRKWLLFSLGWILINILPLVRLIKQGGLFADRYLFFASIGFSLWAGLALEAARHWLVGKMPQKGDRWNRAFILLILLCFGMKTFSYTSVWRDDLRLWIETTALSPRKPRVYNQLGLALLRFGHPVDAEKAFRKALELAPSYAQAMQGLVFSFREQGRHSEAMALEQQIDQLLKQNPLYKQTS